MWKYPGWGEKTGRKKTHRDAMLQIQEQAQAPPRLNPGLSILKATRGQGQDAFEKQQ